MWLCVECCPCNATGGDFQSLPNYYGCSFCQDGNKGVLTIKLKAKLVAGA